LASISGVNAECVNHPLALAVVVLDRHSQSSIRPAQCGMLLGVMMDCARTPIK